MNKRNVPLDIVLTVLMCGLWNIVVQYDQIKTMNALLREEKYNIWKLSLFTILTCGIYFVYYEYMKSMDFSKATKPNRPDESDPIIAILLTIFGMNWVYDAILQTKINEYVDSQSGMSG